MERRLISSSLTGLKHFLASEAQVTFLESFPIIVPCVSVEPEECRLRSCRGDELVWHDGQCHQLASTGPCDPGSWLVLEDIIRGQPRLVCQQRRCRGSGVWWADTCACVETRVRSGLDWPCAETETLMVSPYGDGVCAYHQDSVRY